MLTVDLCLHHPRLPLKRAQIIISLTELIPLVFSEVQPLRRRLPEGRPQQPLDVGGLRHRSAAREGQVRERLPRQGEAFEVHRCAQSSLQVAASESSGDCCLCIKLGPVLLASMLGV